MKKQYDYLIVGAGLFGSVVAYELSKRNKKCLVIDRRNHIGGNIFTKETDGIQVHKYGAHIFHTNNTEIWNYVQQFAEFNHYINSPLANYKGEIFNLPFNMNTFYQMWKEKDPEKVKKIIEQQRSIIQKEPTNLKEQAISLVGTDIYQKLIEGYTEKQWGRSCEDLPAFIIKRLPVRFTYDNNYFNDPYQGIPKNGYTKIIETMLNKIDVQLSTDYLEKRDHYNALANKVVYTGAIDEYFEYQYGVLDYRSLRFEEELLQVDNFQGVAVMNYTDKETPFTRIIEHKHFDFIESQNTIITKEYSSEWDITQERYYPVNDDKNQNLYLKYLEESKKFPDILFGGRLGQYQYFNMDQVIKSALDSVKQLMSNED